MVAVSTQFNLKQFDKIMNNIVEYSYGFLDGTKKGKDQFLKNLGRGTIEALKQYIDVQAKMSPGALHHVYEWHETGSPGARLYNIDYVITGTGLSFNSTFSQSRSIKNGSTVPFYDKARIMENGIPVTIKPVVAKVLSFEDNGEQVFTPNPVRVENPGGDDVQGTYERTFDSFFRNYFKQSFLRASGILEYLSNPVAYKTNFKAGSKIGKAKGIQAGYTWMANATIEVEY